MKRGLKLRAIVRLDHVHPKWQTPQDVVHEANGCSLIARIEDLHYADAGAIIDRRELVQPALAAGNSVQKFHVQLQSVSRLRFLIALPPFPVGTILLVRRQPMQLVATQNAMDRGHRDRPLVEALEVVGDSPRAKVILLPQIQNLADDVLRRRSRTTLGYSRPVAQRCVAPFGVPLPPFVEGLPGNAKMPAGVGHGPAHPWALQHLRALGE